MANDRKQIGAGWIKQTDRGEYVSLSFKGEELQGIDLSNCWVSLVVNGKKANPKHPDYLITASPKAPQPQATPEAPKPKPSAFPRPKNFAPSAPKSTPDDEDWGQF